MPVILVTAKADTQDIVNGLEAGGDDYLTKPFEQAALLARVRSLLRIKELHDTVQQQASKLQGADRAAFELESNRSRSGSRRNWRKSSASAACSDSWRRRWRR